MLEEKFQGNDLSSNLTKTKKQKQNKTKPGKHKEHKPRAS